MHLFLKPIMEELVHLEETGILIDTPYGSKICKARLRLMTIDLPARAIVMNMKYYNGEKYSQFCLQSGTTLPEIHCTDFGHMRKKVVLRDNASLQRHSEEALKTGTTIYGVKGVSPLARVKSVDLVKSCAIDWMHCVLLGVTRKRFEIRLSKDTRLLLTKIPLVDKRFLSITDIPKHITTVPRSVTEWSNWKANEFRTFLIHYGLPVLRGTLPLDNYIHFTLLVAAIRRRSQAKICVSDVETAYKYLDIFCCHFENLYEKIQLQLLPP
ncbi:uncharacterized protein LOC134181439 [Corticium candelabrum]|uniref:uncharacterized protein LOC134181439 n=1 Tax=Corticium candelabrum TaxID=121492 RepID=UPI002E2544AC|nr:uncharacterized protein LOC134181439 [Corticium candelabrum]